MSKGMTTDARARLKMIEAEGAEILSWKYTGNTHVKCELRLPNGNTHCLIVPNSGSDHRGVKNMVARVRRWMREPSLTPIIH